MRLGSGRSSFRQGTSFRGAVVQQGSFLLAIQSYYLSRYWLMQILRYAARGYPERAYARWLVLSFMWSRVEPLCRSRVGSDAFRRSCERDVSDVITPLLRASDEAFKSALLFFRSKRGSGPTAQDVSSFFRRRNLHREFGAFWRGRRNPSRRRFEQAWTRFRKALDSAATA